MRADQSYCDFLVLAPLTLEIKALEKALEESGWALSTLNTGDEFPYVTEATISDSAVSRFRRHAVIIQLNHQGVLNASVDTARALEIYEPGYVVSFGIAGTFNSEDAPIGAVVFATPLFYYEPSKEKSNNTQSRMDPLTIGNDLLNPFREIAFENMTKTDGPFASGEKLFADIASADRERILATNDRSPEVEAAGVRRATVRERILAANDKILGVEMEAAGVGRAVNKLCPNAEFVVIKGISDLADENKNIVSEEEKTRNRASAATNAARCLAQLMKTAPLRRVFRSIPRPSDAAMARTAMREAKEVSDILEPYGIRANYTELYACLYGRRGPIPAYYHWRQYSAALHWIDFKILTAIRALPKHVVTPVPLVTITSKDVRSDQLWHSSVQRLLGVYPTTNAQIEEQREEISSYIHRVGFTSRAEQETRSELERLQPPGRPEITLNLMRYMLGQFCHRRLFVFTWKSYRGKWENLSRALGTWFSIFEWETMLLAGKDGKHAAPGKDLLIEPRSYASLNQWLDSSPTADVLEDFLGQFKCHQALVSPPPLDLQDPAEQLKALMEFWDKDLFA